MIAPIRDYQPEDLQHRIPSRTFASAPDAYLQLNRDSFAVRTVAKYPIAALVAAGFVGLSLGWLVKRRLS